VVKILKPSIRLIIALILILFILLQVALFYLFITNSSAERTPFSIEFVLILSSIALAIIGTILVQVLVFKRIKRLLLITRAFAKGDFSARADLGREDELGMLGTAFNEMAQQVTANYEIIKQNEARLTESESRFRSILNTMIDGVIVADSKGGIEILNPAAERIFGYSAAEIVGQPFSKLTHANSAPLDTALTAGKREIFGVRKDGSLFPMDMALNTLTYGQRVLFTAIVRDITERRRDEESLRLSTRRLEGLLAIDDAILKARTHKEIATTALTHIRSLIPCQWVAITKIDAAERRVTQLAVNSEFETKLATKGTTIVDDAVLPSLKNMTEMYIEDLETIQNRHKNYETLFEEGIRSLLIIPMMVEGEIIGTFTLGAVQPRFFNKEYLQIAHEAAAQIAVGMRQINLYEQVQSYAAELGQRVIERTAEVETFKTLVHNALDGIVILDPQDATIVYANPTAYEMYGYELNSEELIGKPATDFWLPEDRKLIISVVANMRQNGWSGDVRQRRKDGSVFEVSANAFQVNDAHNRPFFGVSIRNITERKQTERSLLRLTNFQRAILDSARVGIISTDLQGIITSFNPGAEQMLGYTAEEVVGQIMPVTFIDHEELTLYTKDISQGLEITLKAGIESLFARASVGQPTEVEWTLIRKDGSRFPALLSVTAIHDEVGGITGFLNIATDITARKRVDAQFRALLESAPDAMVVVNETGKIILVNTQTEKMFGYGRAELLGKTVETLIPEDYRGIHPTHRAGFMVSPHVREMGAELDLYGLHKNGTQFPIAVSLSPIQTEDGLLVASAIRDITERKKVQALLVKSRDFYLTLFESFPALIWRAGINTKCDYFNTTWLEFTGRTMEQEIGFGWVEGVHPEDHERCLAIYLGAFEKRQQFDMEYRLRHHTGDYRWVIDNGNPFYDLDGRFAGYVGACYDITERKEMEQALVTALANERELGELKSRFVSMASHEFRTPLATILATTDALGAYRHKMDDTQIDRRIGKIRSQVDHLRSVMDDVLQLARMQAGKNEFNPVETDFDEFCRDILDEFQSQPDTSHRLNYACDQHPLMVMIDHKLMRKIIANLVSNAIKYSPDKATVYVHITSDQNSVNLSVRDEGIGIPEEDQKHLFEAFHRGVNVGTISGTGLGLSIAKQSVDLHGGTITCESVLGQGTTFKVTLPISKQS
jgi:PAS domain S-box-containing protein